MKGKRKAISGYVEVEEDDEEEEEEQEEEEGEEEQDEGTPQAEKMDTGSPANSDVLPQDNRWVPQSIATSLSFSQNVHFSEAENDSGEEVQAPEDISRARSVYPFAILLGLR